MVSSREGSFRLFRFNGISVSVHWSWFLAAAYFFSSRGSGSPLWTVVEYLGLFGIVLLHEFGHSLACRSTGGRADDIVLWPLGGLAFVSPPQRPGAQLWSIAAGPLVNVALAPLFYLVVRVAAGRGLYVENSELFYTLERIRDLNLMLLGFNLLPIYPMDGGQILRSLLWYKLGPVNSLFYASGAGLLGGAGLIAYALSQGRLWLVMVAGFLFLDCVKAFGYARAARRRPAGSSGAGGDDPSGEARS